MPRHHRTAPLRFLEAICLAYQICQRLRCVTDNTSQSEISRPAASSKNLLEMQCVCPTLKRLIQNPRERRRILASPPDNFHARAEDPWLYIGSYSHTFALILIQRSFLTMKIICRPEKLEMKNRFPIFPIQIFIILQFSNSLRHCIPSKFSLQAEKIPLSIFLSSS